MNFKLMGLFLAALLVTSFSQAAIESTFVVNQKAEATSLMFDYGFEDKSFEAGSAKAHKIGFEFRNNLTARQSVWARGQMIGTTFESVGGERRGYGLGEIQLGSRWGDVYDLVTVVYGANAALSPGMARNPRWGQVNQINSFSGYHSLAPFVGFESYSGSVAFGVDAEVRLFSDIRYEDRGEAKTTTNPNRFIPKIRGFAQIPVIKSIDFGVQGAISRNSFALDQLLLGSPGNQYEAEIYGLGKISPEIQMLVALSAKSLRYPLVEDSTNLSLGVRFEQ